MPGPISKTRSADALVGLWTVALTAFIVAALYIGRDLLIPLSLAALLTFLLTPIVTRLERWIGRICAVLFVVTLIFAATGGAGWVLTRQLVDLATKLPDYKQNIQVKLRAFKTPSNEWTSNRHLRHSKFCAVARCSGWAANEELTKIEAAVRVNMCAQVASKSP